MSSFNEIDIRKKALRFTLKADSESVREDMIKMYQAKFIGKSNGKKTEFLCKCKVIIDETEGELIFDIEPT